MLNNLKKYLLRGAPAYLIPLGAGFVMASSSDIRAALGMGLAVLVIMLLSSIEISAIRNFIPQRFHLPIYVLIVTGFTTLVHMLIPLPKMVKNDIMETDYSFWKLKQLSQEEMIKEVCKIKKEKIEAVIEKKNEEDSPEKFMENCRKNYSDQNIL
jgi:hypothetical protein